MATLTKQQLRLRAEIEEIASAIAMDHWNIKEYPPEARTPLLTKMKNQLVRSEVILKYTLIDEFLTDIICNFYFRKGPMGRGKTYRQLWKTKKFQIFVHYLMDEIFLAKKLSLVQAITNVDKKVMYKKLDLFTKEGLEAFAADYQLASDYLVERAFGIASAEAEIV